MKSIKKVLLSTLMLLLLVPIASCFEFKSDNVLYNQLMEIMRGEMPAEGPAYAKNLTDTVCPLVTENKLNEMMASDGKIRGQMDYSDFPEGNRFDPTQRKTWNIRTTWTSGKYRHLYVILSYVQPCEAYIYTRSI